MEPQQLEESQPQSLQTLPPIELHSQIQQLELPSESQTPLRKRHRQNLQDVSNTKSLSPPVRSSGRIRVKIAAAASELQKPPEPPVVVKPPAKVVVNNGANSSNNSSARQRRRPKKIKTDLVSELAIDVKRPSSVLVDTSIRALLTNVAFAQLSPENQKILIESLPLVDRPQAPSKENQAVALNPSSINNEFFNRACIEWRDRLSNGEFTNEHQTKLRAEHEREKSKIDPWKARNFEGIWGIKTNGHGAVNVGAMMEKSAMEMKDMVEQGDFEIPEGFISEVWKEEEEIQDQPIEEEPVEEEMPSWDKNPFPPQIPSITTSVPTPPEVVTSTQPEPEPSSSYSSLELERLSPVATSPAISNPPSELESPSQDVPVIAEATSSADSLKFDSPPEPTTAEFITEDEYGGEIASQVELSSDGNPTKWYHQQEHDYLKNVIEPEPSGMDEADTPFENEISEGEMDVSTREQEEEEVSPVVVSEIDSESSSCFNNINVSRIINTISNNSRLNSYDTELPQEIFHKPESVTTASSYQAGGSSVLINNFVHHQEPVVVRPRFNPTVVVPDDQNDAFMIEEAELEDTSRSYRDEIHMNVPKNVKLLAFPSTGKYNEKFIIEEAPHPQQQMHQQNTVFRPNGSTSIQPIQNSYFVGGTNFAYISKMGNKIETVEPARIVKQESNNNQGQLKQRIIYEIATEQKIPFEQSSSHHVTTYTAQPQPEVFHQHLVKHPNGTTTIYETSAPQTKKTIIQRKKTIDPYTVQVVANNNTIILTPIGGTQQTVQQQPQKSIVHIHRSAPMMQTSAPVQFLSAPQTFLKKQTVIHPQMTQKQQSKFTTVIRTPTIVPQPPQQQIITTVSSKIQRPIQKQKVIMSTSSLQQYRYNQKPSAHGSRKQLHPQHIIRPVPSATATTTVIHHQIMPEQKPNQIPVMMPSTEHVIMPSNMSSMSMTSNQLPAAQTNQIVTIGPPPGINNIYVRPKRPQQIFHQPTHQHLNNMNTIISSSNLNQINQQQQQQPAAAATSQPRMRHQNNHKPPPGTVNLERSYQICQAVIQNSCNPNRMQLNNQLKKF